MTFILINFNHLQFEEHSKPERFLNNYDQNDYTSLLAYIVQLEPNLLLPKELNSLILCVYECLKQLSLLDNLSVLLETIDKTQCVIINKKYKLLLRSSWFCKILFLASLQHHTLLFRGAIGDATMKKAIVHHAIINFRPDRNESIQLLQLIASLASFLPDSDMAVELIVFSRTVSLYPLNGFKQYAEKISKKAIRQVCIEQRKMLFNIDHLPLKGLLTSDLEIYLTVLAVNGDIFQQSVTRVIEMFSNNIENRQGGSLYKILLNSLQGDFNLWKRALWPQFFHKLQVIDYKGEFFQSFVKYWIPQTVLSYKTELCQYVSTTSTSDFLKGHILLETRKRFPLESCQQDNLSLLLKLFSQEETRKLALQIVGCHCTKVLYPARVEVFLVRQFLTEQNKPLSPEDCQALYKFLSQLSHTIIGTDVDKEYLKYIKKCLVMMFSYGISLLNTDRRSLGAQIVMPFCNGVIGEHIMALDNQEDEFLKLLKYLKTDTFRELIEQRVLDSRGNCQELSALAATVVNVPKIFVNQFLMTFIDEACNVLSIKATESVKNLTGFMVAVCIRTNLQSKIDISYNRTYEAIVALFESDWTVDIKNVFRAALLFEMLNQLQPHVSKEASNKESFRQIYNECFFPVALIVQQKQYQQWSSASCKTEKIVEALYNSICQYLHHTSDLWATADRLHLMEVLLRVIERSSMRKPTMLSADLLKHAAFHGDNQVLGEENCSVQSSITEDTNRQALENFKTELLSRTLRKLEVIGSTHNLTIRRNPDTRLVLHAICVSDVSPKKHYLTWSLDHLLQILSTRTSTDAAISATLHCLEILISNNTLYNHTLKYAPEVLLECVRYFENRNWVVRNACVQLLKALVDRFLGVRMNLSSRCKSIDDLFHLFPQIASPFCRILLKNPLTDSALAVMQFFSESHLKNHPYPTQLSVVTIEAFLKSFIFLIKERCDMYGYFAAKAYVSLCLAQDIHCVIPYIVKFVMENVDHIRRKNTMRNFMILLQELYDKYVEFMAEKLFKPVTEFQLVHTNLNVLTTFLRQLHLKQFDLLLIKVLSEKEALRFVLETNFDLKDYQHRLWLHNYLPFLVINTPYTDLSYVLNAILGKDIPDCLQVKTLSIIINRFTKENWPRNQTNEILNILVRTSIKTAGTSMYLVICYFKIILVLFECSQSVHFTSPNILDSIRPHYNDSDINIYKVFTFLLILTETKIKTKADRTFIKSAINNFQKLHFTEDEDLNVDMSKMLKYLYASSSCIHDRRKILKLALFFITHRGLWHFADFITESTIPTPIRAAHKVLEFRFLKTFFNSDVLAYEFVKEFYTVAAEKSKQSYETYYVEEDCVFVDRHCISGIVKKFLYEFCKYRRMDEWLEYYTEITNEHKISL